MNGARTHDVRGKRRIARVTPEGTPPPPPRFAPLAARRADVEPEPERDEVERLSEVARFLTGCPLQTGRQPLTGM